MKIHSRFLIPILPLVFLGHCTDCSIRYFVCLRDAATSIENRDVSIGKDANLVQTSGEGAFPSGLILGQGLRPSTLAEVSVGARSR